MEIPNGDAIKNAIASLPEFGGKPSFLDAMNDVELVDWLNKEPGWYRSKVIDLARQNATAVQAALDNIQAAMPGTKRAPTPVAELVARAWKGFGSEIAPAPIADDDGVEIEFENEADEAEFRSSIAPDLDRTPVEFEPEEGELEQPAPETVEFEPEEDESVVLVEFTDEEHEISDELLNQYWGFVGYTFRVLRPLALGIKCEPGALFEVIGLDKGSQPDMIWFRSLSLEVERVEIHVSPKWFEAEQDPSVEWVDWEEEEEEEDPALTDPASQLYADDLEEVVHQLKLREAQIISAGGKEAQLKYLERCFGEELDLQLRDILRLKNEAA